MTRFKKHVFNIQVLIQTFVFNQNTEKILGIHFGVMTQKKKIVKNWITKLDASSFYFQTGCNVRETYLELPCLPHASRTNQSLESTPAQFSQINDLENNDGMGRHEREKVVKYQDLKNDMPDTYNP